MISLSWMQAAAFRLRRHHLARRAPPGSLVMAVRDVCGVQAQLMSTARVALWARVQELTSEDVERALWQERTLVKVWCMRGTVHLLPAADLPVYVGALRQSRLREERRWLDRRGVSPREAEAMVEAVLKALDGGPLTRRELSEQVVGLLGPKAEQWVGHSWGGVVKQAVLRGLICFGPDRGREITFVRRDQWLPELGDLPVEETETTLLRRYLRSYGPATPQDFAAWTGMRVKEARAVCERLEDEAVEVTVEDSAGWLLRQDLGLIQEGAIDDLPVRLLPSFDSYLLGHRDKNHLVDEAHYKRVYRKAGWLSPVILVDGRVAGIWSHKKQGRRLSLTVEPFGEMSRAVRRGIETEAEELARFSGATCELVFE